MKRLTSATLVAFGTIVLLCLAILAPKPVRAEWDQFTGENYDLPYDQNTFLTAHDSFDSTSYEYLSSNANQDQTITNQLNSGVRGLIFYFWYGVQQKSGGLYHFLRYPTLSFTPSNSTVYDGLFGDQYDTTDQDWYCAHGEWDSQTNSIDPGGYNVIYAGSPLQKATTMLGEVASWLSSHPHEVITIGINDFLTNPNKTVAVQQADYAVLLQAFQTAGLGAKIFWSDRPNSALLDSSGNAWEVKLDGWPTLRQLASNGLNIVASSGTANADYFPSMKSPGAGGDFSGGSIPLGGIVNQPDPSTMGEDSNCDLSEPGSYLGVSDTAVLTGSLDSDELNNKSRTLHDYVAVNRLIQGRIPNIISVDYTDHGDLMDGEWSPSSPSGVSPNGPLETVNYLNSLWRLGGNSLPQFRADDFEARESMTDLDGTANLESVNLYGQNGWIVVGGEGHMHRLDFTNYKNNPNDGYHFDNVYTHVHLTGSPLFPNWVFAGAGGEAYAFNATALNEGPLWSYNGFRDPSRLGPIIMAENVQLLMSDDGQHLYAGCYGLVRDLNPANGLIDHSNNLSGDGNGEPNLGYISSPMNGGTSHVNRLLVGIQSHVEYWDGDDIQPHDEPEIGWVNVQNSTINFWTVHPSATSSIPSIYCGSGGIVYHMNPFGAKIEEQVTLPGANPNDNGPNDNEVRMTSLSTPSGTILFAGCDGRVCEIPLDSDGNFLRGPTGGVKVFYMDLLPLENSVVDMKASQTMGRVFAGCNGRTYEIDPPAFTVINMDPLLEVDVTSKAFADNQENLCVVDDPSTPMLFSGGFGYIYYTKLYNRDQTPPVVALTPSALKPGQTNYATKALTVQLYSTDPNKDASGNTAIVSGVQSMTYSATGVDALSQRTAVYHYNATDEQHDSAFSTNSSTYSDMATIPITTQGETDIHYWATDFAGNTSQQTVVPIIFDDTAPVTVAQVNPTISKTGWYRQPVSVQLTATDNLSGVASTEYRISNGMLWASYRHDVSITRNGAWGFDYYSTDKAGNMESLHHLELKIDTVAPSTTCIVSFASGGGSAIARLVANDNLSGVATVNYQVDDNPQQSTNQASTTITIAGGGQHKIRYWSQDVAGNSESAHYTYFTTPPLNVTQQVSVTLGNPAWTAPGRFTQSATITNTGSTAIAMPVVLELDGLSATITLTNATGTAGDGYPYIHASGASTGSLAAGKSVAIGLTFSDPSSVPIYYSPIVFSGQGTP